MTVSLSEQFWPHRTCWPGLA